MKRSAAFLALGCAFSLSLFAQAAPPPTWESARLPNGLEIIVAENHATPFVRVDLAFKAGAIAQTSKNAGAFHVLEHALLAAGGTTASAETALGGIGAIDWKAETGAESMSFNMKIPSSKVADGIGIWAAMVLRDSFDDATVDAAKARAANEAAAQVADPQAVFEAAETKRVFSRYPWRRDPVGSEKRISELGATDLAKLKQLWLVPSNAALIVTGDVSKDAVVAAATSAFANWKSAPSPWRGSFTPQPKLGVMRPTWFAVADDRIPEGMAMAEVRYRGPDLESSPKETFVGDLLADILSAPGSRFQQALAKTLPNLHGPALVQFLSQRDGSVFSVGATFDLDGKTHPYRYAEELKEAFRGSEVMNMKLEPSYLNKEVLDAAKQRMIAARDASLDTIDGMDSELRFAWSSASKAWFTDWETELNAVDRESISDFLTEWILHNLEVVAIRMNPADMAKDVVAFENGGFEKATPENSFWWQFR